MGPWRAIKKRAQGQGSCLVSVSAGALRPVTSIILALPYTILLSAAPRAARYALTTGRMRALPPDCVAWQSTRRRAQGQRLWFPPRLM